MAQLERKLKVYDRLGFHYEVTVKHDPWIGISIAYYDDDIIASREYGRSLCPPQSDDDREWEDYEQRLHELADEIETDLGPMCKEYFGLQHQTKGVK